MPEKKIAILHFLPLELYPPVMNLVNCWTQKKQDNHTGLYIYSTPCAIKELSQFNSQHQGIYIKRFGFTIAKAGFIRRLVHYIIYYFSTLFRLIITRPGTVLYYDTISSFPAYCYKRFFNRSCRLFIHYHEYMTTDEYNNGMVLLRWFHRLEKKIYNEASWVSQTNQERMDFFMADMPGVQIKNRFIVPNFPPYSWKNEKKALVTYPVRFIQTGALGMDSMYVKEFAEWIIGQQGKASWDIYSLTISDAVKNYFTSLQTNLINFKGSVNYSDLPVLLKQYDVGVVLYKGHIPNYIYNAPNKMFEYYACGLDTWLPQQMITAVQYRTVNSFPQIVPMAFENLSLHTVNELVNRSGMQYQQCDYWAEKAFEELINKLGEKAAG